MATSTDRLLLTEAQTKLAVLSAELDKLREREIDSARESRARGESAGRLSTRVVELEGELGRVTELARLAEERAQVAEERAQVAEERARVAEQRADTADSWAAGANARADRAEAEARRALVKLAEDDDRAITQRPPPLDDVPTPPTLDSMLPGAPEPVTGVDLDGLERLVAELNAKNEELEARAESFRRKAEALEPRIARLERELEARESMLATERERRGSVEKISAQLKLELATLREQVEAAPPADAVFDVSLKLEMDEEIARLEDALRERGHAVARLKEELREGERVGRELVEQLELSGAFRRLYGTSYGDQGRDGGRGEDPDLRARLAVLAETAAKTEADLTQASWRIAQLERQVELAERDRPPAVVHDELEQALLAARQEIAALRTSIEGTGASSALVEQSVLLSQVAGELDKGA